MEINITGNLRLSIINRHLAQKNDSKEENYKYTLNNNNNIKILTKDQREEYEKNGFIVIRKLVTETQLDRYRKRFQDICANKINVPAMTVMKDVAIAKSEFVDGEKAITKIQDFCHDDELFEYCCLPDIVKYVNDILGDNAMAMHTMLINKPPGKVY
jgi:phytanoyl-CoA hydroxylase